MIQEIHDVTTGRSPPLGWARLYLLSRYGRLIDCIVYVLCIISGISVAHPTYFATAQSIS